MSEINPSNTSFGEVEPTKPEAQAKILVHRLVDGTAVVELVHGNFVKGSETVEDNETAINAAKRRLTEIARTEYGLFVETQEGHNTRTLRSRVEAL